MIECLTRNLEIINSYKLAIKLRIARYFRRFFEHILAKSILRTTVDKLYFPRSAVTTFLI